MKKIKEYLIPTFALFVICFVATALLGITNDVTALEIEALAIQKEEEARLEVFPNATFDKEATEIDDDTSIVKAYDENNNIIGYVVVTVDKKGYGGEIEVMTGVTVDGKVTGISILSHSETPGLGAKSKTDDKWRTQFIDKIKDITVSKDAKGENSIDAITGATITSRAVVRAVNRAIEIAGGENIG